MNRTRISIPILIILFPTILAAAGPARQVEIFAVPETVTLFWAGRQVDSLAIVVEPPYRYRVQGEEFSTSSYLAPTRAQASAEALRNPAVGRIVEELGLEPEVAYARYRAFGTMFSSGIRRFHRMFLEGTLTADEAARLIQAHISNPRFRDRCDPSKPVEVQENGVIYSSAPPNSHRGMAYFGGCGVVISPRLAWDAVTTLELKIARWGDRPALMVMGGGCGEACFLGAERDSALAQIEAAVALGTPVPGPIGSGALSQIIGALLSGQPPAPTRPAPDPP